MTSGKQSKRRRAAAGAAAAAGPAQRGAAGVAARARSRGGRRRSSLRGRRSSPRSPRRRVDARAPRRERRCPAPPTSQRAAQGHPAARQRARLAVRAGDDGRVRRPPVPVLPAVRDRGDADGSSATSGPASSRSSTPDRLHRPRLSRGRAAAIAAGRPEPSVRLRPAALRQPGRREQRLAQRRDGCSAAKSIPGVNVQQLVDASNSSAVASTAKQNESQAKTDRVGGRRPSTSARAVAPTRPCHRKRCPRWARSPPRSTARSTLSPS